MNYKTYKMLAVFILLFTLLVQPVIACTTIIIGAKKTTDGSVLLAHNEDLGYSPQRLISVSRKIHEAGEVFEGYSGVKVPQPKVTYAYIASMIFDKKLVPGDITSGINEYQVSIVNNMSYLRNIPTDDNRLDKPGLIWTEYTQLVLERCKTAREGVELIGQLAEQYHLTCDTASMYGIADPNEGWFVEITRDGQWIAQRVPDDGFDMRANSYRIGNVDLESPDILHSPDIVQYAVNRGLTDQASSFNFANVYGDPKNQADNYNTLRHREVTRRLENGKVAYKDLMDILRCTYADTDFYLKDPVTGSPFHTANRTISSINTVLSCVAQLRDWLPAEIGGCMWWSLGNSKSSPYIPFYYGAVTFLPAFIKCEPENRAESAYWAFDDIKVYLDDNYARTNDIITRFWTDFEVEEMAAQAGLEDRALKIYKTFGAEKAIAFLNTYSNDRGLKAYQAAKELLVDLTSQSKNKRN